MSTIRFEEKEYNTDSLDTGLWKKILRLMKSQKKQLILLFLLNAFIAVFDVAMPYLNKIAIDTFAGGNGTGEQLKWFSVIFLSGAMIQAFLVYRYFLLSGRMEMAIAYELRTNCFRKLQSLSYSYFDVTPVGWLMARMTSDISRLAEILAWSLTSVAWSISVMIGATIVMLITNWQLTLLVLAVVPLLAWISNWFQIRILKNNRAIRRINSRITNGFNEGISGAKTTKTLVLEDVNFHEFDQETSQMRSASIRSATLSALFFPVVMILSAVSTAAILIYGGHLVLVQMIQFGTLTMFVEYAQQFFDPLQQIAEVIGDLQMAQASAERILSLLDTQPTVTDTPEVIAKYGDEFAPKEENYEPINGDVDFVHVGFHYIQDEEVLKDFNLHVKAGQMIALVGETGSGKSTIVNLLCRFYEPTTGQILIDGTDYRQRSIGWLHSKIGYVLQSPHLFSGSIRENIRFGRLNATDAEIEAACRTVNADGFIRKLEKGYDTDVGEGGNRLSTGQKQLISFARAIIANPRLFVLDEATSSVDTETEQVIQETIEKVMRGRTCFIIAHRLSTIVNADKILVLKKGIVQETGTHEELMAKHGYYYRLYTNQFNQRLESELMNGGKYQDEFIPG